MAGWLLACLLSWLFARSLAGRLAFWLGLKVRLSVQFENYLCHINLIIPFHRYI